MVVILTRISTAGDFQNILSSVSEYSEDEPEDLSRRTRVANTAVFVTTLTLVQKEGKKGLVNPMYNSS